MNSTNYTDEQFEQLEQEERVLTDAAILTMLLSSNKVKESLKKELRDFYQKYGKDGVITYAEARKWISEKDHRKRLSVLLLFVGDEFDALFDELIPPFQEMLLDVVKKESDFFDVDLEAYEVTERQWGVDELTWEERLVDDVAIWSVYLANDIKRYILQRKTLDELLTQIDKRFGSIESVINKLALTESTAVGSMAREKAFRELGITKYQFYTRADERTCEVCGSMHGLIFPISAFEVGVTASPLHPHCRCWEVPIWE